MLHKPTLRLTTFIATALSLAALAATASAPASARDQVRIVGSSTMHPITATVVERFGQTTQFPAPINEATGTLVGFRQFCKGIGAEHPDIVVASMPMNRQQFDQCAKNGVDQILEIALGYDGVVVVQSRKAPPFDLTLAQLFQGLAKEVQSNGLVAPNPFARWSEISSELPNRDIEVLIPPPSSGTSVFLADAMMVPGCMAFPAIAAMGSERFDRVCRTRREDGAVIEVGENDAQVVQRLNANPQALGIVGFNLLEENLDTLVAIRIEGVDPSFDTILSGEYPLWRPVYLYVKSGHVGIIPGLKEFISEFISDRAISNEGYLVDKGLIPLSAEELLQTQALAQSLTPMSAPVE